MKNINIEVLEDEFTLRDIGSTLLEELAEGLYQAPEVLREYVQNAVDAHRMWVESTGSAIDGPVQIEFRDDNSISIIDYGIGMSEEDIRRVKSVAVSPKRRSEVPLTGHKGVGIWAGFSFFETMNITSSKLGEDKAYELEINFKAIVDSIGYDTNIGEALNPNYVIRVIHDYQPDSHGTTVTLSKPLSDESMFTDPEKVTNAIRNICPCDFSQDAFSLYDDVKKWYKKNKFELFEIMVDGEMVYKEYPSNLRDYEEFNITVEDVIVAQGWRAMKTTKGIFKSSDKHLIGFGLIHNGFVVGRRNIYSDRNLDGFGSIATQQYLDWQVGEVHITSENLLPNLRRDELGESQMKSLFVRRLRDKYYEFAQSARVLSEVISLEQQYAEIDNVIKKITKPEFWSDKDEDSRTELPECYTLLKKHEDKISKVKGRKTKKVDIKALREPHIRRKRVKLLTEIKKLIEKDKKSEDISEKEEVGVDKSTGAERHSTKKSTRSSSDEKKNLSDENSEGDKHANSDEVLGRDEHTAIIPVISLWPLIDDVLEEKLNNVGLREEITIEIKRRISLLGTLQ